MHARHMALAAELCKFNPKVLQKVHIVLKPLEPDNPFFITANSKAT